MKSLVEEGKADVNFIKKGTKLTALHWAALNNDPIVVSYLLTKGAKMEYSKQYQTPVDVAGLCENLEVRYLETLKNYRSWTAYLVIGGVCSFIRRSAPASLAPAI